MLSINRDFRSTSIKIIGSRVKLARTRSTVATIKQTLPSVIVFNKRQALSVHDVGSLTSRLFEGLGYNISGRLWIP